ncbi:8-amino-7-oxononanoate synthase [Acinetobacter puyangensis]|uniref:8-amino-7-oxononanoate synthase n=1 Tax=Acinetobacter puyangensis TaxID=1096779 RepID=A0A240E8C4_9GAMM|nr:8-amino-7-oxononanoate synthase [Acinetobacter puyangensis]SNX44987.1 8-amino-7-oxononanoate synthase [Acinetobacter puyangensis]
MNPLYQSYADTLEQLKHKDNFRFFKKIQHQGQYAILNGSTMLNLSSNDYLGLAQNEALTQQFFDLYPVETRHLTSSSSRLLTGNFPEYEQLEASLSQAFGRASLLLNSGYHMNIGILPALTDSKTLIISDELIHASIIDGIRLSKAQKQRYVHQDLAQLEQLLIQASNRDEIEKIMVVTESVYSMDGDITNLNALVALKQKYAKVMLYVDEAHAIGIYGDKGLGCAEQQNCIADIDFLVGTFGKALASVGGYLICDEIIREFLINKMRSLIFSTAQPPLNMAWTNFIFHHMQQMQDKRQHLLQISQKLKQAVLDRGLACPTDSHIIPVIYGENQIAVDKALHMQRAGFYVLPIRPPTVAEGTARVRISLDANLSWSQLEPLIAYL